MSLRPTHSREALILAPQHVMVQADKAFKEAIQMRSLGWSPDSKGPASTGETGFGIQPGPEGRPHERKPRGGPSGDSWTSGCGCPHTSVGSAVQTGQMETVSRAVHRGRSHLKMAQPHKARAAGGPPASPGRAGRGRGLQHGWG